MNLFRFVVLFFRIACLTGIVLAGACQAEQGKEWNDHLREEVVASLEAGACDQFWRLVAPYAKQSEAEVASLIAGAIYAHGFVPPGANNDVLFRLRSMVAGFGQSARSGDPRSIEMLSALLKSDVFQISGGVQLSTCLADESDKAACIDKAVEGDLFPSFEQWFNEVALLAKPGTKAICIKSLQSQKMYDSDFDVIPSK